MTRPISVRSHTRHLPDKPRRMDNELHQRLWNEFVGNVLAMEVESELAKLLPDYGKDDLNRVRETY